MDSAEPTFASSDTAAFTYPHRTDNYNYRVPTPPRIVVPPPTLNADALPDITLSALIDPGFLNCVNTNNLVQQNVALEWTYERRREAQMIIPYLYLGPMNAVKDREKIKNAGITMVLGVRQKHTFASKLMNGALRAADEMNIERYTVDIANNQELIHALPTTTALINAHLSQYYRATGKIGKVLVACESGNERSAGVVAAYLMEVHVDVDFVKAMQLCQAQRFCVNFDDAMKRLLQGYWDILCAKRMVDDRNSAFANHNIAAANGNGAPVLFSGGAKKKRGFKRDDDDDDMHCMQQDDVERFGGRTYAPFTDQPL